MTEFLGMTNAEKEDHLPRRQISSRKPKERNMTLKKFLLQGELFTELLLHGTGKNAWFMAPAFVT